MLMIRSATPSLSTRMAPEGVCPIPRPCVNLPEVAAYSHEQWCGMALMALYGWPTQLAHDLVQAAGAERMRTPAAREVWGA